MNLPLNKLNYRFLSKPLLVGGMAMEYYGLRKSGKDIDLIVTEKDLLNLIKMYPHRVKDLYGDLGVCPFEFEIWKTINYFIYDDLKGGAVEQKDFLIISEEKLLIMKSTAMQKGKYLNDTRLLAESILKRQASRHKDMDQQNSRLLHGLNGIVYIEKRN